MGASLANVLTGSHGLEPMPTISGVVAKHLDVEACNGARVLCRLPLGVVEVGRDSDDGLGNLLIEVRGGNLLHLDEDHRRDGFGGEGLGLTAVLDLDHGLAVSVRDDSVGAKQV